MDNPPLVPPLHGTRYLYEDSFKYYFPYGNVPAVNFLECVPWEIKSPDILVLACGDLRSVFYTIWKNFNGGFEQTFESTNFTIHDVSAAVSARNILFLYLCIKIPKDSASRKKWLCAFWSIWFCHELLPDHEQTLHEALKTLLEYSKNWSSPDNPLSSFVQFYNPKTLTDIKEFWSMWCHEKVMASVRAMRAARQVEMSKLQGKTEGEASLGLFDLTGMLGSNLNKPQTIRLRNEYKAYLDSGNAYAEELTEEPQKKRKVNPTFIEKRGEYGMYYIQCPYRCFHQVYITNIKKMLRAGMHVTDSDRKYIEVSVEAYEEQPLLANSFQQFALWVCSTADTFRCRQKKVSFNFVCCIDPISFCYLNSNKFNMVFAFTIIDLCAPPALVLAGVRLLQNGGRFVCGSVLHLDLAKTIQEFIMESFGFSSKFLPVICGIRCVNHEGEGYSSIVSSEHLCLETADTDARQSSMREKLIYWEKVDMSPPLVINSMFDCPKLCAALVNCFYVCCTPLLTHHPVGKTVLNNLCTDTAIQILHSFAVRLEPSVISSHEFWEPFVEEVKKNKQMQAFYATIQIQALVTGIHLHFTLDKSNCPTCLDKPISSYAGLLRMEVPIEKISDRHPLYSIFVTQEKLKSPEGLCANANMSFLVAFTESLYRLSAHHLDCTSGTILGNILQLSCLVPLEFVEKDYSFSLNEFTRHKDTKGQVYTWPNLMIVHGKLRDYLVRDQVIPKGKLSSQYVAPEPYSLGTVIKNVGNGDLFETTLSLAEGKPELLTTKLDIQKVSNTQVKTVCGDSSSVIKYPYPVYFNKMNLQRSKKSKTLVIKAQRRCYNYDDEGQIFHVNPEDHFSLPPVIVDPVTLELFMRMQYASKEIMFKTNAQHGKGVCRLTLSVEQMVRQMLTTNDTIYVMLSLESEQLWGIVEVLNRVVDVNRKVPAVHVSYLFLDEFPGQVSDVVQKAVYVGAYQQGIKAVKLQFLQEHFQYVKEVFLSFSKNTLQSSLSKSSVVPTLELKQSVSQAVVYPLYEDPGRAVKDLQCPMCRGALKVETMQRCACEEVGYCSVVCKERHFQEHIQECKLLKYATGKSKATKSEATKSEATSQKQIVEDKERCAYCWKSTPSLKSCAKCRKIMYCGRECQKSHWKTHKNDCIVTSDADKKSKPKCNSCEKEITDELTKCIGCESMSYCSIKCQTYHWRQHKLKCKGSSGVKETGKPSEGKGSSKPGGIKGTSNLSEGKGSSKPGGIKGTGNLSEGTDSSKPSKIKGTGTPSEGTCSSKPSEVSGATKPSSTAKTSEIKDSSKPSEVKGIAKPECSSNVSKATASPGTNSKQQKKGKMKIKSGQQTSSTKKYLDSKQKQNEDPTSQPESLSSSPDTLDTTASERTTEKEKAKAKTGVSMRCAYCEKKPTKPQRCARCQKVFYCGHECQRSHWKEHKPICKSIN
ncbi:uncharacterized protein LOC135351251 [Halichondria panicea]|uniref:uncharacterized protein LOC135351251 n=1 Tax=Halichondria panicea TaxID=6063 RepID=UPI00312B63BF